MRKKRNPTCIIPIREKVSIKRLVVEYAKRTNLTIQDAYRKLLREGIIWENY